jgi:hypothetical protein
VYRRLQKEGVLKRICKCYFTVKYTVVQLVEVLPYKTEGRGFDS